MLWEEHEGYLHGNWLITKTEPRLFYQFAKFDERVERELEECAQERLTFMPSRVVRRSTSPPS